MGFVERNNKYTITDYRSEKQCQQSGMYPVETNDKEFDQYADKR
jgi:hypothetical protein